MELWTLEFTMSYLRGKVTKALMPVPAAAYHIDEYTDWIGKTIAAHDSRYYVTYDFKKETKTMSLTNINVLEISIYKRWLNFEDDNVITGEKRWENDSESSRPSRAAVNCRCRRGGKKEPGCLLYIDRVFRTGR